MTPSLSVIVPVYNTEKYLRDCIDSILAQTYKNFEIILVDDGSTDNSPIICDEYAQKYSIISVIHKENCGLLHTRKVGFGVARGEYVTYVDSDDYIEPDMYQYMMGKITEHEADVVICGMVRETEGIRTAFPAFKNVGFLNKEKLEQYLYPSMLYTNDRKSGAILPSLCNKIMRKSVLEKSLNSADNSISIGEDALCSFPCLLDAKSVYICENKNFYIYRQVPNSLTRAYDEKLLDKFKLLIELLDKAFKERNFDGEEQLFCYAVRFSLECIRMQLLLDKNAKIGERIKKVKAYLNNDIINKAFKKAPKSNFDKVTNVKLFLIKTKQLRLLFAFFWFKNRYLMKKGEL